MLLYCFIHSTLSNLIFTSFLFYQTYEVPESIIDSSKNKYYQNKSGTCGSSLMWEFQQKTLTLYISGHGKMFDFTNEEGFNNPWLIYNYFNLKEIKITEGVTSIGDFSFYKCDSVNTIEIAPSVVSIGKSSFSYCTNLQNIQLPRSISSIGSMSFAYCTNLRNISIPTSLIEIGEKVFSNCISLDCVFCDSKCKQNFESTIIEGNKAKIRPIINNPDISFETKTKQQTQKVIKETGNCGSSLTYTYESGILSIEGRGSMYSFTASSSPWSGYKESILSVSISENVTSVGNYAFYRCSNLKNVTFPSTLTTIGQCAFASCVSITKIMIPGRVTSIKECAFYQCTNLNNVTTLANRNPSDGNKIFEGISANYAFVPSNYQNTIFCGIRYAQSSGSCGSSCRFTIESNILTITGYGQMKNYDNFFTYSSNYYPPWYYYHGKIKTLIIKGVSSIGEDSFRDFYNLKNITISESVTSIEEYAFYSCSNLQSIIIPFSLMSIGDYAFNKCSNLQNITISDSVISIGRCSFQYCSSLRSIIFPDSLISIGASAFEDCSLLDNVTYLGTNSPSYGSSIFSSTKVEAIFVLEKYTSNFFCGYKTAKKMGKCGPQLNYSIESGTLFIRGEGPMYNYTSSSLPPWYYYRRIYQSIDISNETTSIGSYAFSSILTINDIEIPGSVTFIFNYSFKSCSNLHNVTILGNVLFIGTNAFSYCSSLNSVKYQGDTSPTYGQNVFSSTSVKIIYASENYIYSKFCGVQVAQIRGQCGPNLKFVITDSGVLSITGEGQMFNYTSSSLPTWHHYRNKILKIDCTNKLTSISDYAFYQLENISNFTIPTMVTIIPFSAFRLCSNLQAVNIPEGVTSIESYAFQSCTNLLSIKIPNGLTSISSYTFQSCSELQEIEIPASITTISTCAFRLCSNLQNVTILGNVSAIGENAFNQCTRLNSFTYLGETNPPYISSVFSSTNISVIYVSDKYTYNNFCGKQVYQLRGPCGPKLKFVIESGVLTITGEGSMFNYASSTLPSWHYFHSSIRTININNGATSIGDYAFYQFTNIDNIEIPSSVTTISSYSFISCSNLRNITISGNVSFIGTRAFYQCTSLSSVTYLGEVNPSCGSNIFSNTNVNYVYVSDKYTYNNFCGIQVYQLRGPCGPKLKFVIESGVLTITGEGSMFNYASSTLPSWHYFHSSIRTININNGATSIGNYAFYQFTNIINIEIPSSVTTIRSSAFQSCSSLQNVTILGNVSTINDNAFNQCTRLNSFTYLGETYSSYGSNVFSNTNVNIVYVSDKYTYNNYCGIQVYQLRGPCGPKLIFVIESSVLTITGEGSMFNYASSTLPSWHYFHSSIRTININNGATSIGNYAFYQFTNIINIEIPSSVTTISSYAFRSCSNLQTVKIPNSVTTIGSYAFQSCSYLQNIKIPSSLQSINSYTFQSCSRLQEIEIPASVTTIGSFAFQSCTYLRNVTVLGNINTISDNAFNQCTRLSSFTYLGETYSSYGSNVFTSTSVNVIYVSDKYTYNNYCGIQVYQLRGPCGTKLIFVIESSVLTITGEGSMFNYASSTLPSWHYFHSSIRTINITNGATSIGNYAFYQFTNIINIEIPSSVTTIRNSAFQSCSSLRNVTILGNLQSINNNAFYQCTKLDSFSYLGETSPTYGSNIFYETKFEYVYVLPKYTGDIFCDTPVGKTSGSCGPSLKFNIESNSLTISGRGSMKNYTTKYFAPWYFYQENIQTISISNEAVSIGDYAFHNFKTIQTIIIPSSVVYVGNYAFSGSINLRKVTYLGKIDPSYGFDIFEGTQTRMIYVPYDYGSYSFCSYQVIYLPEAVTGSCGQTMMFTYESPFMTIVGQGSMDDYSPNSLPPWSSFKNLIRSVELGEGVSNIGDYSFYECINIDSFKIANSVKSIGRYAFSGCANLREIKIPTSVTEIKDYSFYKCPELSNIQLPSSVEIIGEFSFSFCTNLNSISIPKNVNQVGQGAFSHCTSLMSIVLPETITFINDYMFSHCSNITQVKLPSKVNHLGDYSFSGCSSIVQFDVPNTVTSIGIGVFHECSKLEDIKIPEIITTINSSLFSHCTSLMNINLPSKLSVINENSFSYCTKLDGIQIPKSVKHIGSNSFSHCLSLTEFTIPEGITTINDHLFSHCTKLKQIKMPESLKSILNNSFAYCCSLESIDIPERVSSIDSYSFSHCSNLRNFVFPERISSIDSFVFYNCTKLDQIKIPERVNSIGSGAFAHCQSLREIEIPARVNSIGKNAFGYCTNLNNVTYFGEYSPGYRWNVFEDSAVESVYVPSNYKDVHFCDYPIEVFYTDFFTSVATEEPTTQQTPTEEPTTEHTTFTNEQTPTDEHASTYTQILTDDQTVTNEPVSTDDQVTANEPTLTDDHQDATTTIVQSQTNDQALSSGQTTAETHSQTIIQNPSSVQTATSDKTITQSPSHDLPYTDNTRVTSQQNVGVNDKKKELPTKTIIIIYAVVNAVFFICVIIALVFIYNRYRNISQIRLNQNETMPSIQTKETQEDKVVEENSTDNERDQDINFWI